MKAQNFGHLMFQLHSFERQRKVQIYWLLVTVACRICRLVECYCCVMATSTSISKTSVLIVAFCLLPTKPTQGFSPQQVWERHGTERPGMVASQRAIYAWLSATSDPGRAPQILARQHNCDGKSQQSGHPSHVRVWCSLSAWPTVYRWSGSQLWPSAEPPVSSTWIFIFCDINPLTSVVPSCARKYNPSEIPVRPHAPCQTLHTLIGCS